MALRMKKNSAFLAYQLAGSESDNSADERREQQKDKQKAKKKSRAKKKNSDSAVLKDLAMCAISKPKKSKGKAAKSMTTTTTPPELADEAPVPVPVAAAPVAVAEEKAPVPVPTAKQPQPKAAAPVAKVETTPKHSASAANANAKASPGSQHAAKPQGTSAPPSPAAAPNGGTAPPNQQNGTDLGAIYSPTHVKITRADGQMTRTIAVSEMMDQLYLFGNQNAQLRVVQEQLTMANRSMQEQLQRDAEIINSLQNEVTMFRQMCLNLQAERAKRAHQAHTATFYSRVVAMHKLKSKLSSSKSKQKRLERAQSDATAVRATDEETLRMSKHVQEEAHRFQRNTTMNTSAASSTSSYMSDDVEEMFYNGGGTGNTHSTNASVRSTDNFGRSTTSSMRSTDTYGNGNASSGTNGSRATGGSLRVTDVYRTTEQMRGTNLMPLQEDEVLPAASRMTATMATMATGSGSGGTPIDALRAELSEMKLEVQAIRRDMMNEMHVTRYDVLKEITMLKGTIIQLVSALESKGVRPLDAGDAAFAAAAEAQPELSSEELDTISRTTALYTSKATKERRATREDSAPVLVRASSRLTQLAPVADDALSTPLLQHQIDEMFPLVECSAELQAFARNYDPSSREWAIERFQEWVDSRFNVGVDNLLALVGDGGSGKSTLTGALCDKFHDNVVAMHLCVFDRKSKSSPRNVLLSLVNQLISNLPLFKNQLARLNLKYVLEETDPLVLARKVLVDPLCALEEPMTAKVFVFDGVDQCKSKGRNDLLDFLAVIIPELPTWIGVFVTSKPSPELPAKLAITSLLDFSAKNTNYMNDTIILLNDIIGSFSDKDVPQAREILKRKSGGNFTFLDFTKQALSHPGMEEDNGYIPLDVLHDLPESIYEIYEEIFEDKFGKGRNRIWKKVQPLLELIVTAASGPYALITENQAQEQFSLSKEDIRTIRRSFVDIIAVHHGTYRIETSALFEWLVDPQRAGEQFYVDVSGGMNLLRQLHHQDSSETHSAASSEGSSNNTASNVSTTSSHLSYVVPPPAAPKVSFKPVGILKKK